MPVLPRTMPTALEDRAAADLRYIRETMANAASFTALSGLGFVVVGLGAVAASIAVQAMPSPKDRLGLWFVDAGFSLLIGLLFMERKGRLAGQRLLTGPFRKFALGFSPSIAAGAVLTCMFVRSGNTIELPAVWLLCYGAALIAGGTYSARIVPAMGICFMLTGVIAALFPAACGDLAMLFGFGGLHVAFGFAIAWKHGG